MFYLFIKLASHHDVNHNTCPMPMLHWSFCYLTPMLFQTPMHHPMMRAQLPPRCLII